MNEKTIAQVLTEYPFVSDYFTLNKLDVTGYESITSSLFSKHLSPIELGDLATDKERLLVDLSVFIQQMNDFLGPDTSSLAHSLTILPGHDKTGVPEGSESLTISSLQIISIVGPTGSGGSHLLADIEQVAQGNTSTGRSILVNEEKPDSKWRFSSGNKLVVQLSQNTNFVVDLTAQESLELYAQSRPYDNADTVIAWIIEEANRPAGEQFRMDTPITSLSGGQSHALTIADTAILSISPIVPIDEIENAGIDRKKAPKLPVAEDKIMLMVTHDPLLALITDRRIVIRNGGIRRIFSTSEQERQLLEELERTDAVIQGAHHKLRDGQMFSVEDLK